MGRIFESFSRTILILLVLGGMLVFMVGGEFLISIKPSKNFEDLMEMENIKAGMHIKGDVQYTYDCFAREETWKESSSGSRTPASTSHYYYVIPVSNGEACVALEVSVDDHKKMEALAEETVNYLLGGSQPSTKVSVDGGTKKMKSDMKKLFVEYLEDFGYTSMEIDAMTFLVIEQPHSMATVQVMFLIGAVLVAAAIIIFVIRYKKNAPAVENIAPME